MHEPRGASRLYCPINQNEPSLATDSSRWRGSRNEIDLLLTITHHENPRPWFSFKDGIKRDNSSKIYEFLDFSSFLLRSISFSKNEFCYEIDLVHRIYFSYPFNIHTLKYIYIHLWIRILKIHLRIFYFVVPFNVLNIFWSKAWRIVKTHLYSGIYHRDFYSCVWWTKWLRVTRSALYFSIASRGRV